MFAIKNRALENKRPGFTHFWISRELSNLQILEIIDYIDGNSNLAGFFFSLSKHVKSGCPECGQYYHPKPKKAQKTLIAFHR